MTINYQLTTEDFLAHQLYSASRSELQIKDKRKKRFIPTILFVVLGAIAFVIDQSVLGVFYVCFALIWVVCYPWYRKIIHKKHLKKQVLENFKNRIGIPITLEFGLDSIDFKDNIAAGSINATKVASLIETKDHFFVKLVTDTSFIIPKKEVQHPTSFKTQLANMGAQYVDELQWQWQ